MFEFLLPALVMGSLVAILAAPLGCLVVWRKMAYFGDTMAHSGLLGTSIALFFSIDMTVGVMATSAVLAVLLYLLSHNKELAQDTLLGMLSHGSLALGLILISLMPNRAVNLDGLLFGDILLVSWQQCLLVLALVVVIFTILKFMWRSFIADSIHHDLARAEGISHKRTRLILMLMLAMVIAAAMKVVGILLITSILIIPAASARRLARSPEAMVWIAMLVGVASIWSGIWGSVLFDTPTGPSIVVAMVLSFVLMSLLRFWFVRDANA